MGGAGRLAVLAGCRRRRVIGSREACAAYLVRDADEFALEAEIEVERGRGDLEVLEACDKGFMSRNVAAGEGLNGRGRKGEEAGAEDDGDERCVEFEVKGCVGSTEADGEGGDDEPQHFARLLMYRQLICFLHGVVGNLTVDGALV